MKNVIKGLFLTVIITLCGCMNNDSMEDITIYTTTYPIEYVVNRLYDNHSTIKSIYPNGVDVKNYEVTNILLDEYSNTDMFIFNGLDNEKNYVKSMLKKNDDLKIIDATDGLTYTYYNEELWLNPNNVLAMANNIKKGFNEYIQNSYLKKEIEENYEELKKDLTSIDAKYRNTAQQSNNTIVVSNNMFLFLKKYGMNVISLEENSETFQKDLTAVKSLIDNGKIKYIYVLEGEQPSETITSLTNGTNIELIELHTLSNLNDDEKAKYDYLSLLNQNLESLKLQLY